MEKYRVVLSYTADVEAKDENEAVKLAQDLLDLGSMDYEVDEIEPPKTEYRVAVAIEGGVTMIVEADNEAEAQAKVHKACDWGADVVIADEVTDTVHREWFITDVEEV